MPARPAARATAMAETEPPPGAGSSEATRSRNSPSGRSRYSDAVFSAECTRDLPSEQPDYLAVLVEIYVVGRGRGAQAWHGAHVAADRVDEPGPRRDPGLAHRERPARGRSVERRIRGDGEVRLGHADRQLAEALLLEGLQLAVRGQVVLHTTRPVDLRGYGLDLLLERRLFGVEKSERGRLFGGFSDRLGQFHRPRPPLREVLAHRNPGAHPLGDLPYGLVLRVMVSGEGVDRHHRRDAVKTDVLYLFPEVGRPGKHIVGVLLEHLLGERLARPHLVASRVGLERPHRGDEYSGVGFESRDAALDVEEAFRSHVGPEARLGYEVVAAPDADKVGHDG